MESVIIAVVVFSISTSWLGGADGRGRLSEADMDRSGGFLLAAMRL